MGCFLSTVKRIVKQYLVVLIKTVKYGCQGSGRRYRQRNRPEASIMGMLSDIEVEIAKAIQADIPCEKRPFRRIADAIGITEDEVIATIESLIGRGFIRRFGAVLGHRRAGFTGNAMVIWAVPSDRIEEVGILLAAFEEVSHCYEREPAFEEKYNLFTMIHLKDAKDRDRLVRKMTVAAGIGDYLVLASEEEYKKSSMEYFR
jgi:DNA-binding Lrp family transcriptional regulator